MAVMDHVSEEGQRLQPSFMGRVSAFNGVAVGRLRQTSIFSGITHQTIPDKQRGFFTKGCSGVEANCVGCRGGAVCPQDGRLPCALRQNRGAEGPSHTQMCVCSSLVRWGHLLFLKIFHTKSKHKSDTNEKWWLLFWCPGSSLSQVSLSRLECVGYFPWGRPKYSYSKPCICSCQYMKEHFLGSRGSQRLKFPLMCYGSWELLPQISVQCP